MVFLKYVIWLHIERQGIGKGNRQTKLVFVQAQLTT